MTQAQSERPASIPLTRPVELTCFALCVTNAVYLAASFVYGSWLVDPQGHAIATDFVNVWAGGRQALDGNPAAAYDVAIQKAAEVTALGHPFHGEFPWNYPPSFLFVATLLALIPYVQAYAAWVFLTFPLYVAAIRGIVGDRIGLLLACAFPAILSNARVGRNGFVTAALLGGALLFMERRPLLAGRLVGVLSFKPHLGILFPIVLIAGVIGASLEPRRSSCCCYSLRHVWRSALALGRHSFMLCLWYRKPRWATAARIGPSCKACSAWCA